MKNNWVPIPGYESQYEINRQGMIKSLDRFISSKRTRPYLRKGIIRKVEVSPNGYIQARLCKNGVVHTYGVHRLLALTFISNPDNKPQINHIDGNKHNNSIENLEWCDQSYNMLHSRRVLNDRTNKPVACYDYNTRDFIRNYPSVIQASEMVGIKAHVIIDYLRGRPYNKRYHWQRLS